MTEATNGGRGGIKTLGIKLPPGLHAQFALVAQLDGISLGDAALRAVELYVTSKKAEADFASRAQTALEEIEREAAARRGAIEGLFGQSAQAGDAADDSTGQKQPRGGRPRRTDSQE